MKTSNIETGKIKKITKENLKKYWLRQSLKQKMKFYVAAIIILLVVAIGISFSLIYSYLNDFNTILQNNNYNQRLNAAF